MRPNRSHLEKHWSLDPDVTFLNHGSFGATPNMVLEEQNRLRLHCLLYTSPSPRDATLSRMPSSA